MSPRDPAISRERVGGQAHFTGDSVRPRLSIFRDRAGRGHWRPTSEATSEAQSGTLAVED